MSGGIGKVQKILLDSARTSELKDISGREIQVVDASSAAATIGIALQDNILDLKFFDIKKNGRLGDRQGFSKFYIKNTAQAGEWVKIIVTDGNDDFYVENSDLGVITEISEPIKTKGGAGRTHGVDTVGTSAVELMAANADRTGWYVFNNGSVDIFIGDSGAVTDADGTPVPPKTGIGGDDGDAIHAISGSAGQDVRHFEVQ